MAGGKCSDKARIRGDRSEAWVRWPVVETEDTPHLARWRLRDCEPGGRCRPVPPVDRS